MSSLRNIRERKGFNISQLASRSGIASKTLLEYEEGRVVLPLAHARLLAKALWVEVDELMPVPGSVPPSPPAPSPASQQDIRPSQHNSVSSVAPVQISANQAPAAPIAAQSAPPVPSIMPSAPSVSQQPQAKPYVARQNGQAAQTDARPPRTPKVIPPATEGQVQELLQLAQRLDISQEQLEERVGKSLATLTRPDATDWVKRLRAIADEIAPASKVKYGRWPDSNEDREATYLAKQRDANTTCVFHLFNGEEFSGAVSDFTPYTITIRIANSQEEMVLRKLAIAYYRCIPTNSLDGSDPAASDTEAQSSTQEEPQRVHTRDDHHQSLDKGIDSDRAGQPEVPQRDKMDEDRGI